MKPDEFINELKGLKFQHTFNPYIDICERHDRKQAPLIRARMLLRIIKAAARADVDSMWIGRDLGFRGGRRTGLAFTDDVHLDVHCARWNINVEKPTTNCETAERTASIVWQVLRQIDSTIFLWNVFPLHPHVPEQPFTNRAHSSAERKAGVELLSLLIELLQPNRLVSIGADATRVVCDVQGKRKKYSVRHPSFGGQTEFLAKMRNLYDVE